MTTITTDQIGAGDNTLYGADVAPNGPVEDMFAIEPIAGQFPAQERSASPGEFTGGTGGAGLGGQAEPMSPGGEQGGTVYQRRGF
jgi:hypothetical protein